MTVVVARVECEAADPVGAEKDCTLAQHERRLWQSGTCMRPCECLSLCSRVNMERSILAE